MAHDVFVSHSSSDAPVALAIVDALESAGIRCWIAPRNIQGGQIWAEAILQGISGARAMVVVFSSHANRSVHVLTEVDAAVRRGAIVVPFRIEPVMPEGALEYHLRTRHWLDALTPALEAHIGQLVDTLRRLLEVPGAAGVQSQPWLPATPPVPPLPRPVPVPRIPWYRRAAELARAGWRGWGRLPTGVRRGTAGALALGALYLWFRPPSGSFVIRDASASGDPVELDATVRQVRFFEGPRDLPPAGQRVHDDRFAAGATRYLYVELDLDHGRAAREVRLPITCVITDQAGAVFATITATGRIQPEWEGSTWASGWGSEGGGSWVAGRYAAECSYGGDPIARGRFEMVTGGAPPGSPPAPAPAPAADRVDPRIPELDGRVVALRFFPDSAGPLTPLDRRQYRTSLSAADLYYLGIELELSHPPTGRTVAETVECEIRLPDGSRMGEVVLNVRPEPTWTGIRTAASYGWPEAGRWGRGAHRVSCRMNGRLVAEGRVQLR